MITVRKRLRSYQFVDPELIKEKVEKMIAAIGYADFDVFIWLTNNPGIKKYNATFRKKNSATDILSFPHHPHLVPGERIAVQESDDKNLGDILISLEYVAHVCRRHDMDFLERIDVLLAHGIAHLLNYDHQTDDEFAQMQVVEKKLLRSLAA